MIVSLSRNGRPPDKREQVVSFIRGRIVSGKLGPEDRIPTHQELERLCDAGSPTIRAAMEVLRETGFITTQHRKGTFVVPHPPHLAQFAVAFPSSPVSVSRFYEAIRNEAEKRHQPDRRISLFHEIDSHTDAEDYQRLLGWVEAQRLAGLIFAGNPYRLARMGSPLVTKPGVWRTAIMAEEERCPFPTVYPDTRAFLPRAFNYLASRGRKRVAVVTLNIGDTALVQFNRFQALAAEYGLTLRPHWLQAAVPGSPEWSRQTALLLLHGNQSERPDALVITDDNLVEGITEGVLAAAAKLEIVAQANFPYATRCLVPAKRLGYDITRLMAVCLERIEQQRRGEHVPVHTTIPAVFEEELGSRCSQEPE